MTKDGGVANKQPRFRLFCLCHTGRPYNIRCFDYQVFSRFEFISDELKTSELY